MRKLLLIGSALALGNLCCAQTALPLFSIEINKQRIVASSPNGLLRQGLSYAIRETKDRAQSYDELLIQNNSRDTIELRNLVPLGALPDHVYISGLGEHGLSRAHLFMPGKIPVNIILPDNAWELGASFIEYSNGNNVCALMRRDRNSIRQGQRRRFETILFPGGEVTYRRWTASYTGSWQEGLRILFQQNFLYDTTHFDNSLYERKDLHWIRHSYVMHLMQAWDKFIYDAKDGQYHLKEFMDRGKKLYGGDEVIGIWPTWPSLGLDQRNQFDLFRDLPGGTKRLQQLSDNLRKQGSRFFICYNPWDESTRSEGHLSGLGGLVKLSSADGVVLDTRGASSKELQEAADKVRKGVIMYSEGMAIPKDMPGIVSGRVHNALYYPPMLNLNKFIKPEFAIFRVAELFKEPIRREFALSFFNGYGTEINMFAPGQPDWAMEQYQYLGKTSRILRENTHNFTSGKYTPLILTTNDSIWVNEWRLDQKIIYTIYSIIPQGYKGNLFVVNPKEGFHFVDIWHHRLLNLSKVNLPGSKADGEWSIPVETEAFHKKWLGTNNEGAVDCIAQLPELIKAYLNGDVLSVNASAGTVLRIWAGDPDYQKKSLELKPGNHHIRLSQRFGRFEGDFVIQLFDKDILLDETIVQLMPGKSRRVSSTNKPSRKSVSPPPPKQPGEVEIAAGKFVFKESHGDEFIPYPSQDVDSTFDMPAFYMDKYPVTNAQFNRFINGSGYKPRDNSNFLKHWVKGKIPKGMENFPVVYISYEDAQAYAKWAGKRLPTEIEWQYSAQTPALNEWPWVQKTPVTRKEEVVTETLTVTAIEGIDSAMCNLGDGQLYPVGKYSKGANAYGLQDLVGCVWQLTNDVYMNGSYQYIMMKGGSYFKPSSSWWYVQGGPRELHYRQYLLRVSQGFERNATVGFRCVRDKN